MEGNEPDWKSRCGVLEEQLARFREQAAKVREVIGQKVKDLEEKNASAEEQVNEAMHKITLLENKLKENETVICNLNKDLESERQERIKHAQQIEAKASSIREWVQTKMSQVDMESSQLRLEIEHMKRENVNLREANHQADTLIKEMKVRLKFSQDQVLRLSEELADFDNDESREYQILEPPVKDQENNTCTCSQENGVSSSEKCPGCCTPLETNIPTSPTSVEVPSSPMSTSTGDAQIGDHQRENDQTDEKDDTNQSKNDNSETAIKRSSSGKSPSKIPRYIGQSGKTDQQQNPGKVSYYMSLKRGKENDGNRAKFYIQVHDMENTSPYMQLVRHESNTTIDSERDSLADAYSNPFDFISASKDPFPEDHNQRSILNSVTSLCSNDPSTLDVNSLYEAIVKPIQSKWRSGNNSEAPQSPPPPLPPRFDESMTPPPVPPIPQNFTNSKDIVRTLGEFTSYLPSDSSQENIDCDSIAPSLPSWVKLSDSSTSLGTDSPPYATLESTKNLILGDQAPCPVYATLKGRASQIRNTPFSGESTDSSDHDDDNVSRCSDDYLKPVDSDVKSETSEGENSNRFQEKTEKVLKTCAAYTTVSLKKEDQRKEGYLTKLGGRIKNWKKRWFVLEDGKLYYYKTPTDVNRKPLGQVPLDGSCRISRTEGDLTIEVSTPNRTYYLTGETLEEVDEWLRVLHNVMRKFTASPLLAQMPENEVMSGWITKVKNGSSKRSWCVLRGKYLCYYKNEEDTVPYSMANLMEIVVEELETAESEEDRNSESPSNSYRHFTLVLKGENQSSPTYLLIDSKAEKDSWLFHLIVSSGSGLGNKGTDFEKVAAKLVSLDGNPDSELWNTPILTFSKEAITKPLTTLPSEKLEEEAIKLFKSILLFTTVATEETAIDYHVSLAQNALQIVLDHPELQNEIYCMLVKQTSKQIHRGPEDLGHFLMNCGKRSWLRADASVAETIDLRPVQEYVYLQTWQLMALCTSLFVPKEQLLSFVKAHLKRSCNLKTRQGKYAAYCVRSLERTIANGKREARPSRMEVISILLQNPYDHSCPMSLPVHFVDGKTHVFGFDGSTTVEEFIETINASLGIRDSSQSGYAIFTDNPVTPMEHCLQASVKLCDVICKWEQAMRSNCKGRLDSSRVIKLSFKNRLYFKSLSDKDTPKEKYFMVFQTNINVVKGRFPVSRDIAIEFAALMAQINYGDYKAHSNSLPSKRVQTVISKYFPKHLKEDSSDSEKRSLTLKMAEKWSTFHGWNDQECVDKYLENARRWPFFGSKLFKAQQRETTSSSKRRASSSVNSQPVWLAVEEDSISILEGESLRLMCRYKYKHVVTFGGCKDDFMLVVNQSIMRGGNTVEQGTQRLLFNMTRGKILEITLLMASYINAIVRQKGITCDLPPATPKASGGPLEKKVWDLESAEWPIVPGSSVGLL
ncbi:pleckstrin homology domain-containing family H member 1-like isoform X2 [Actinia tenebrosa]|uniref:Pleckstrin homology domain-containing family H member 1-like isoform X2 n=1 Tax=Actinia tenebrosa TaxID=6105 RepID=A0A6P8J2G8_ACTTE|nr:pleckstrin homology domain-containing family H member 1-like isoform X2 [Actinia tenebrosa]